MAYAELLCRSNFSFLRGGSHPEELIATAAAQGYTALGLADLDGVYGLAKAQWRAKDHPGIRFIAGAELSLEGGPGLVLHAADKSGWSLLCRLLTASHAGKPKGEASLGWADFLQRVAASPGRQGLICIPRGPGIGEAASPLEVSLGLKQLFEERLYIPVARHLDGAGVARSLAARELARGLGARVIAVNDVHYHIPARRRLQDALTCVREGVTLNAAGYRLFSNAERYLKSAEEMQRLFRDWPEAISNGLEAAERCRFSLNELRYRYPSEWIPSGETGQSYLETLCWQGAAKRYPAGIPSAVRSQVARELALIQKLDFADYFLTIFELVDFARSRRILCQGRGSAANSAVCYCLGITSIDPVRSGLLFERFISEERAEPPDIDVDFEHERREEVIQHLYERYGRDRAGMVSAVIKYRSRSAVADLSKVFGAPTHVGRTLRDTDLSVFEPRVAALASELRDFPRHLSIHSGGFVLSGSPLIDLVPIEPGRMEGRSIVQWDKYDLDYIGLMKVDVLSLGMLTALRRCMDATGYAELADLPAEDAATYAMIGVSDTIGVFQIESRAQMNMLGRLKPANFYDLVIEVAIVRPGPIVGKMVHPYLRRRKGEEAVVYEHPKLEAILGRTLGVPLFQEQVMRIAIELGGFSPGQADELRRAIGAWRSDGRLDAVASRLKAGLKASGLSAGFCERLFNEIKGFAEYGFPESHAASFALLTYASCYLKCHHPAEFTAALINSQPLGFYANHSLVDDLKRHGVTVRAVDPNSSDWDCRVVDGELWLGWKVVDGLGKESAVRIMAERDAGRFSSIDDFIRRARLKPSLLRRLAMGDVFAAFGIEQREALWRTLLLEAYGSFNERAGQLSLFLPLPEQATAGFGGLDAWQAVAEDYKAYGLSTKAHPMQALRSLLPAAALPGTRAIDARKAKSGSWWRQAGLCIVRQRPGTAAGVVFATLEDETGLLDMVLWKDVYERYREAFLNHSFFCVEGVLQRDRDAVSLLMKKLTAVDMAEALKASAHNWH